MTKEQYVATLLANKERKEKTRKEAQYRYKEKLTNKVIEEITNRIEDVDERQYYVFNNTESAVLSHSELFDKKLAELRQKYDFLDIFINTYCYSRIESISWCVKKEVMDTVEKDLHMEKERRTCCICGKPIDNYGNDPQPLCDETGKQFSQEDRCCDACNTDFVVPYRLLQFFKQKDEMLKIQAEVNKLRKQSHD